MLTYRKYSVKITYEQGDKRKMTKEELIKLSRENLRKSKQGSLCECYDEAFIKGYELSEKQIAELEKENKVLAQNLEDTEILNKTYEKRFSDLEKENAELKLKLEALEGQTPWKDIKDKSEVIGQLTKAKEILERLLITSCNSDVLRVRVEAEQFIKDSEVEK